MQENPSPHPTAAPNRALRGWGRPAADSPSADDAQRELSSPPQTTSFPRVGAGSISAPKGMQPFRAALGGIQAAVEHVVFLEGPREVFCGGFKPAGRAGSPSWGFC